ncbi:DUF1295 domain-containing protein [Temperatibacter marinus]|uniref:DUF1295 domain-containing protein n=1 Tax=Temperatibacter marinus TaxID=1456591 RepID=A0AA52EK05_9PROT|nr:DUF1295 domain-containing protein [Temperatibacter marinus]WND03889.1 DUF1295 domain-containing protein [Temperatibacter marinus]
MKILRTIIIFLIATSIGMGVMWLAGGSDTRLNGISLLVGCGLLAYAINWIAFIPAALAQTEKYYDITGTLTYLSVTALACYAAAPLSLQGMIVAAMVVLWALRLGSFLFTRITKDGHDRRFNEIKLNPLRFLIAWTLQGTWVTLTAACALYMITTPNRMPLDIYFLLGTFMWCIGFAIEVVADNQKKAFRKDPSNKEAFIQTGLWSWSRHPNYFGEILLWAGIALMAMPTLIGAEWILLISPIFVYFLLTKISGIPMLQKHGLKKWGENPDYQNYIKRTSLLLPLPPRSS